MYVCIYSYIYIYRKRDREIETETERESERKRALFSCMFLCSFAWCVLFVALSCIIVCGKVCLGSVRASV